MGRAGSSRGEHAGATRGARWAVGCSPLPTSSRRHDQKRPNPRSTARKAAPSAEGARATLSGGRRRWRGASSGGISPLSCTGLGRSSRRSVCSGEGTEIPLPRLAAARGGGAGAAKVVLGHLVLLHGHVRARHHQGAMGQGLVRAPCGRLATARRLREVPSACWLTRSHARANFFFGRHGGLLEKALYPPSLTDNRGPPASVLRCASHGARGPYNTKL